MPLPVLQSIIGVCKTIIPNKFIYSTIHIYLRDSTHIYGVSKEIDGILE